ncbi:hypothetical protein [Bradyrhizobium sp. STM 3557]|uniref:hypothetical protein n=1 Tax=Bradyrhizobium sp. STM 3557 TaxID=578920 RepID=UPI0038900101
MYVFGEFNRANIKRIHHSVMVDLAILLGVWTSSLLILRESEVALELVMIGLLAVRFIRIPKLVRLQELKLTAAQYAVAAAGALVGGMLLVFAYSKTTGVGQNISWDIYKSVVLAVGLSIYLLAYVDFAIASLVRCIKE